MQPRKEAGEATQTFGASLVVAGQPDTAIVTTAAITAIEREIERLRAHVVVCPSRDDLHQDHAAVAGVGEPYRWL